LMDALVVAVDEVWTRLQLRRQYRHMAAE
jgi:hypothetical protein